MRSLILSLLLISWGSFSLIAQEISPKIQIEIPQGSTPWNHLDINADDAQFQIAIVTDRTGGHRPGVFADGVSKINLLQPEFVMSVGDLIEGYTEDTVELNRQWNEFDGFIKELQMPFFYVPGNHDYTNPVMAEVWEDRLGPSYYHFVYKDVLFLCLNSERDRSREEGKSTFLDDVQFNYFKKALEENPEVKWTLLFMHKPMWIHNETGKWNELEALLSERKHTVFAGHHHHYVKYERNNGKYFMLATTGGGSSLQGPQIGEFDHVMWLTMTEDGPVLANLMLQGIWDEDVVTEKQWDFVGPIRRQNRLKIEPVLLTQDQFTATRTELKVTNDSDAPMIAHIQVMGNVTVESEFYDWEKEIAPNSEETIELALNSDEGISVSDITPLHIKSTYTYAPEDLPSIEFTSAHTLLPLIPSPIAMTQKEKQVDGSVADWDALDFLVADEAYVEADKFSHNGAEDASYSFSLAYDEEYVYAVANVIDDDVYSNNNTSFWLQDGIAIAIDPRPAGISANETNERSSAIFLWQTPEVDEETVSMTYGEDRLPEGTKYVCKKTEKGFIAEIAIPHTFLDSVQGSSWEYLRVNTVVQDIDNNGMHNSRIYWKPMWSSEESYIGSGLFRKVGETSALKNEEEEEGGKK